MLVALVAVIGVSIASTAGSNNSFTAAEREPVPYEAPVDAGTSYEISADDVVDAMGSSQQVEFCRISGQLTYGAALEAFAGGYGTSQDPSAQEVFDELLSRC